MVGACALQPVYRLKPPNSDVGRQCVRAAIAEKATCRKIEESKNFECRRAAEQRAMPAYELALRNYREAISRHNNCILDKQNTCRRAADTEITRRGITDTKAATDLIAACYKPAVPATNSLCLKLKPASQEPSRDEYVNYAGCNQTVCQEVFEMEAQACGATFKCIENCSEPISAPPTKRKPTIAYRS
jgi:hypothetical protein